MKSIRILAQQYDKITGEVEEETLISDDEIKKAVTLKGLGYLHIKQIEILQKAQDFRIKE